VHDARTNTRQYSEDSEYTHNHKGKTPGCESNCHDKRPEERRAIDANKQVKAERQQYRQQQKDQKQEEKKQQKKKKNQKTT
jgi:hypothetical protein